MLDATQKYGQHIIILFMLRCQTDTGKKNIPDYESSKYLFYVPALMPKERLKISFAGKELLTNLLMR